MDCEEPSGGNDKLVFVCSPFISSSFERAKIELHAEQQSMTRRGFLFSAAIKLLDRIDFWLRRCAKNVRYGKVDITISGRSDDCVMFLR